MIAYEHTLLARHIFSGTCKFGTTQVFEAMPLLYTYPVFFAGILDVLVPISAFHPLPGRAVCFCVHNLDELIVRIAHHYLGSQGAYPAFRHRDHPGHPKDQGFVSRSFANLVGFVLTGKDGNLWSNEVEGNTHNWIYIHRRWPLDGLWKTIHHQKRMRMCLHGLFQPTSKTSSKAYQDSLTPMLPQIRIRQSSLLICPTIPRPTPSSDHVSEISKDRYSRVLVPH